MDRILVIPNSGIHETLSISFREFSRRFCPSIEKNHWGVALNIKGFLLQNKERIETSLFNNPDYIRATRILPFRQYEATTTPEARKAAIGPLQYISLPSTDDQGNYSQARSTSITSSLEIGDAMVSLKMVFKIQVLA
jgi:hypothetical protein